MREVQAGVKESLSHPEDSQVVDQVTQRSCAVAMLGGFKDLTGQSPEQPGLSSQLSLL